MLAVFSIPSEPGNERIAMDRVTETVRTLGLSTSQLDRLNTAVGEVVMNAMEHGNHYRPDIPVIIGIEASKDILTIRITDQGNGPPIRPSEAPDLEAKLAGQQPARGWGLFLVKNMVDDVRLSGDASHHTVELTMKLDAGGRSNANQ